MYFETKNEKKWLIFDVMGVIFKIGDDTNDLLVPFIRERNIMKSSEEINEWYNIASKGEVSSEEFWKIMEICESGKEVDICKEYLDTCLEVDESFIDVARRLGEEYNLAILSNDVSEWSQYLRNKYGIDNLMKCVIISGDVGIRKPDNRIYEKLLEKIGDKPENCVYIDDREKNLIPAENLGMKGIRFSRDKRKEISDKYIIIQSFKELENVLQTIWN